MLTPKRDVPGRRSTDCEYRSRTDGTGNQTVCLRQPPYGGRKSAIGVGFSVWSRGNSQGSVDLVQIESCGVKCSADPFQHSVVLFVLRIIDGGQELFVPVYAADIFGRYGSSAGDAERIGPIGSWFGNRSHSDLMSPAITEIVLVDSLTNRVAENIAALTTSRSTSSARRDPSHPYRRSVR